MAIYSERWPTVYAINTVTELELTTSQNVTNNYTRVSYVVRVKKVNNTNDNWTPASGGSYLTLSIGGNSVRSNYRSNWTTAINSRDVTAVVDSGYTDVYHDADGTKTINFSLSLNPNVTVISNMPNRTISGSFVAATIPRASTFTVGSSLTTGTAYTVSITRASTSFTHRVYRKIGDSEVQLTTSAVSTSYDVTMPHSLFNSYPNSTSISASIIVKTFNGTTEIGSKSQNVTINLTSSAIPTNSSTTWSNTDSTPLTSNQMIRGVSRLTLGVGTVSGSYSSTISSYEFSYQIVGSDWTSAVSSSTRSYIYPAFNFPTSGSVVLNIRSRVKDSRGRYSNWSTATVNSAIRVHNYAPPSIGNISVKRAGSGNTTLQVYRSHSVTPLYQGGSTSDQKNTANLRFQTRELGGSTISTNTGGTSTSLSTTAAWVNLAGAFTANKSYQVRAVLSDARQTVYGSWVTVGTEFVPLDIGPKGIGVGKVHSDGSSDLEIGGGGINSDGPLTIGSAYIGADGVIRYANNQIQLKQLTAYNGNFISQLSSTGNFNDDTNTGFSHMSPSATNSPGAWGILRSAVASDTHVSQIYHERDGYNKIYTRAKTNGEWKNWNEVAYANGTMLNIGQDLNHDRYRTQNGRWFSNANATVATLINAPDTNAGWMEVVTTGSMSYQTWYSYAGGNIYFRRYYQSWGPWYNVSGGVTTGNNSNGNWYQVGSGLLICSQNFSFANKFSDYTLTGSWTFPKAFSSAPSVSATGRTSAGLGDNQEIMNGTLNQVGNTTTTGVDFSWHKFSGANFGSSSRKYLTVFAIGFP